MNFSKLIHCVLVGSFALSGFGSGFATTVASAAGDDPAGLLPADTVFYAVVPNVAAARAKLEKTSLWHLYKEPAMQAFVVPAEKAIREAVQEKLKEAWSELGIDAPPSELPLPTGRVVLGLRMVIKTRKVSAYDFEAPREAGTPPVPTMREVSSPVPQVVVIAEMGQNFVEMKRIFEQATEKAVDKGAKRRRETVRG
ncbi:MAG: hypothetical protein HQ546_07260, partial [Planctomycetes bacterium]|nr:hypothetical protein [Planctomycetota bacterium]